MQYQPCNQQDAVPTMQPARCSTNHATSKMQYQPCNQQDAVPTMQPARCSTSHGTSKMQYQPCNQQINNNVCKMSDCFRKRRMGGLSALLHRVVSVGISGDVGKGGKVFNPHNKQYWSAYYILYNTNTHPCTRACTPHPPTPHTQYPPTHIATPHTHPPAQPPPHTHLHAISCQLPKLGPIWVNSFN